MLIEGAAASILWCVRRAQGRLGELGLLAALGDDRRRQAWTMVGAAQIAMAREDERTARYAIDSAFAGGLLDMHLGLYWLSTMAGAADACAWLRDLEHAALLALSTGPLALALGRRELAEERLRGAVALCECMQAPAYLAIAHSEPGRMLRPSAEARACSSARAPRRSGSPCPAGPRAPMPP